MAKDSPPEYGKFESLTRKLLGVPKADLDKQITTYNAHKEKRKKAKKK